MQSAVIVSQEICSIYSVSLWPFCFLQTTSAPFYRIIQWLQWEYTMWLFQYMGVKMSFSCLSGGASRSFSQPGQRSFCKEPGQFITDTSFCSDANKVQLSLTQDHLPLPLPSEHLAQVPPSAKLQRHLQVQFPKCEQTNFLQNQKT